jgi:hypothetical protein
MLMTENLRWICKKEISDHYLGQKIKNELIDITSKKIKRGNKTTS